MQDATGLDARREYHAQWRDANRDRLAEYREANRERIRRQNREFYSRNKERRKALRRGYYKADPAKNAAYMKKWVEANPDRVREIGRRSASTRRARIKGVFVEQVDPVTVFVRDAGICGICKTDIGASKWEIDHMVPISMGGAHCYDNVQLAHLSCNRSKGSKCSRQ